MLADKVVVSHEIYSLVGILGASEFAIDQKLLAILVEVRFFNLNLTPQSGQSQIKRYILPELTGYFELFQATLRTDLDKRNTLLSRTSLAAGFRDTLNLLCRYKNIMDADLIKSVIKILHKFMTEYQGETDFHQILYEATVKACRLEHALRSKLGVLPTTPVPELTRAIILRKGLSQVLIRAYAPDTRESDESLQKSRTFIFISRVVLDLIEEEAFLISDHPDGRNDKQADFTILVGGTPASGSVYRYNIRLVAELCNYRKKSLSFSFVFKLVTQKFQVGKLVGSYATCHKEPLKEYYLQMLILLATCAGHSRSEELLQVVCSQACLVLADKSIREKWIDLGFAVESLLSTLYNICHKDSVQLSAFHKVLIKEYLRLRIDHTQSPFDESWVETTRFMLPWVAKIHRQLSRMEETTEFIDRPADLTLKFWFFVMLDYHDLQKKETPELKNFALAYSTLIEPSERIYSNSFLSSDLTLQQDIPKNTQIKINKAIEKSEAYEKYFEGLSIQESMYLLAILHVISVKIEAVKNNPKGLMHELGSEGSVLRDILLYLSDYLLLEAGLKKFRHQFESLLVTLANEYVNTLVDLSDITTQQELAHRDFIVLCQFCLSSCTPFAYTSRSYLIQYMKLFPPVFFKESVLETLAFAIDRLTSKLNLNYSNISETIEFPYYSQSILAVSSKDDLKSLLNLMVSVLTNLYFVAYIMSRYLTKSVVENFLKAVRESYSDESLGKQFLSYISQIEPELKKNPANTNYFLVWLKETRKFYGKLDFDKTRLTPFMKSVLKAYTKSGSTIDLLEFKTVLSKAPQTEKNFLEHFVGALDVNEERLSQKLKDLNVSCMNLEICLILKKLESKHENCLLQLVGYMSLLV